MGRLLKKGNDITMDKRSSFAEDTSFYRLHTFVQAVHASLDPLQMGQTATTLLSEAFQTRCLFLYQADPAALILHLLSQIPGGSQRAAASLAHLPYSEHASLLATASQQDTPLLIPDLHDPASVERAEQVALFVDQETHSCLCLPLWCGGIFEGVLIAGFAAPLIETGWDLSSLLNWGLHLATALSRARQHQQVTHEHLRLRQILDQLPEGVIVTEVTSGLIRYANPVAAHILGRDLADLVGAPLQLPASIHQRLLRQHHPLFFWTFAVIRALSGETLHQVETVVVRSDGTQIPVLCSSTPLWAAQGKMSGAILILQDITAQKHLERDKNAFLSQASHELRTPLTAVLGYADLLHTFAGASGSVQLDPAELRVATTHITSQAERMAWLIDEMLDLSALDQDQLVLHVAEHNLTQILTQVVETQTTATNHQLHLLLDPHMTAEDVRVRIDATRVTRAFHNMVNNAMTYSPQGGDIEIGMRLLGQPSTQVMVWVRDHGLGIAQEDLPHVFDRFYRSATVDRAISGLGVGLYLTKQVILRHGGRIWAESVEGRGATFFVILPLPSP
ncbi:MAG: ATP-binding protein [Ktedonobacteraceae bacterium]